MIGIQTEFMGLLKTIVQTNSDTLQSTQALMLAVLQNQQEASRKYGTNETEDRDCDDDSVEIDEGNYSGKWNSVK